MEAFRPSFAIVGDYIIDLVNYPRLKLALLRYIDDTGDAVKEESLSNTKITPEMVWKDFDPRRESLDEEIIRITGEWGTGEKLECETNNPTI